MNVLAFDTCLSAVSVAVRWRDANGDWSVREAYEARSAGHAERLMPMLATVMEEAGLAFSDIARIAVTVGPGSFTGVRIGVAAARALVLATGAEAVGATSLAVMAHRARLLLGAALGGRLLAVAVDARRGMVYLEVAGGPEGAPAGPRLLSPTQAAACIGPGPAVVVGSGAGPVAAAVAEAGGQAEALLADLQPHAGALARMAQDLVPARPLEPLYLRQPDVRPQDDKTLPRAQP